MAAALRIGTPKEVLGGEKRVAMTPDSATFLLKLGYKCVIQSGAGLASGFTDISYIEKGVEIAGSDQEFWDGSDIFLKVRPPTMGEIGLIDSGKLIISFFYPSENKVLMEKTANKGISVIAMDLVPRISRAQKMDALSSMANIAGYRAVIEAGHNFGRFFTGQITAAGKVPPARVLVIGAGVAGLAAIGTATSLGAMTYAFDVRPEVAEQIQSMGAEFVFLDFLSEQQDGAALGGYAAPSSPEFREKQLEKFRELAPNLDIVICTALIPGRDAPKLWLEDMVASMKPGSVIIDLAAERGGNCDVTVEGEKIVTENGVTIVGYADFPSRMAAQSSALYASNIRHMLADLTPGKNGLVVHNMEDDVIRSATITHQGLSTYPPPPLKVQAIAEHKKNQVKELSTEEKKEAERIAFRLETKKQIGLLIFGTLSIGLIGLYAPASFMQHFIVFVLSCFIGFQVIWNVSHALHTPLMAVTNAISGIVILGALLQVGSGIGLVIILSAVSILIASINIVGGFMVTKRMLAMFQKS